MENIDLIYRKKGPFTGFDNVNDLIEPELKKKIRLTVLGVHFGLLGFMVLWYLIANFLIAKKPQVIHVTLVTPETVSAVNPTPTPPTPKVVKPTPPAVKPQPQPQPKPKPKPQPTPKPKPVWKPRSADDIKISEKVIKNDPAPPIPAISADDIEKKLKDSLLKNRVTTTNTQGTTTIVQQNYFEKISALMYQYWQQPGQSELQGKYPAVDVEITVDGSGRVVNTRLKRKSGIAMMDQSAEKLLRELRTLPAPPSGKTTFTVTLQIIQE